MKKYTIIQYKRNYSIEKSGNLEELKDYCKNLLNYSNVVIKSIKKLVSELNKCSNIKQACCYHRDFFELVEGGKNV